LNRKISFSLTLIFTLVLINGCIGKSLKRDKESLDNEENEPFIDVMSVKINTTGENTDRFDIVMENTGNETALNVSYIISIEKGNNSELEKYNMSSYSGGELDPGSYMKSGFITTGLYGNEIVILTIEIYWDGGQNIFSKTYNGPDFEDPYN